MLELVNRARANPLAEAVRLGIDLNAGLPLGTITTLPKPPLAFNRPLISAARGHSQWMLDADIFSHTGAGGSDMAARMRAAGYVFSGSWQAAENIAWSGTSATVDLTRTTQTLHDNLIRSAGHRENIMNGSLDEIGIGLLTGAFISAGRSYNALMGTQNFARSDSTPGPMALGVVYRDADGNGFYTPGEGVAGLTVSSEPAGSYFAVTSASGGYAFPLPAAAGTFSVVVSGAGLAQPLRRTVVAVGTNVKSDFSLGAASSTGTVEFVRGTQRFSPTGNFQSNIRGPVGHTATILGSSDLRNWTPVTTVTFATSTVTFTDPQPSARRRLYRAQVVP